ETGKDADVVLWENYPLSSYAQVRTTWIDGEVVFDIDRDMAMQTEMAAEKARLKEMLGEADEAEGGAGRNRAGNPGNRGNR
ncbi:MAG: hypothetical protein OEU54_15030, partial [Gemmatimonadota bacterium]|nr:hypothetical protein [Gemmatimonadota bacterium]